MSKITFDPFPVLVTERLTLRKLKQEDTPEIFIQRTHPVIQKFIKRVPPANKEEASAWISKILLQEEKSESITWAMELKNENKLMGTICLWNIEWEMNKAEIGYGMHPDYYGKGLMSEALLAVVKYGFDKMKIKSIDAYTNKNNNASLHLLEKNNFVRNLAFEKDYPDKEELEYNVIYTLENNT